MKKTSVISINLKFMRIPLLLSGYLTVICICIILSLAVPAIKLSDDTIGTILSANLAFKPGPIPTIGAYSIKKVMVPATSYTSPVAQKEVKKQNSSIPTPAVTNPSPEVKISNSTEFSINPKDYLSSVPSFLKSDFSVLIVHTHTTESYTPSEKYNYTPTDTDRTTDKNFNMVSVGNEIENILSEKGIKVYHDESINDYPSYNGSYNKSADVIENHIKKDSSIKIVLDVHRDAIEETNGKKVKYTSEIGGKTAAKIMFVVGSDLSGLKHENWQENMCFAANLQRHTLSLFPELCRPITFRSQRFNQQLAPGGIIVEIGTNGNTLDEAIYGAQCFAVALADFIDTQK